MSDNVKTRLAWTGIGLTLTFVSAVMAFAVVGGIVGILGRVAG